MNASTHAVTGILFPGQGSQENNMGRDVAEASKDAMDLWKKAEKISNAPLREIYWDGDEAAMSQTQYLQPALTVVNLNLWAALASKFASKECVLAGHSLGEFSALAAARVLPVENVIELVALRGQLMSQADPDGKGKMAAILKVTQEKAEELVKQTEKETEELLLIANYNSPAQFVASGMAAAVDALGPAVKEAKGRLVPLAVSGAFHSPLMEEANKELAGYMNKLTWSDPKYPIFFNATAQTEAQADKVRDIMCVQMTSSVRWIQIVKAHYEHGVRAWYEIGPKQVLTRLLKANLAGVANSADEWQGTAIGSLEQVDAL